MYRRHLEEQRKMSEQSNAIGRVSNYPVVRDSWNKFSEVYRRGKGGSRIFRFYTGVVESGINLGIRVSTPMISHLPMETLNQLAVKTLEGVEQRYPIITKPREQMSDLIQTYSKNKVEEATAYGTERFNRMAELTRLTAVLDFADSTVDVLLPAPEDKEEMMPQTSVVAKTPEASSKIRLLTDKVKQIAYQQAMAKVGALQQRSQEAMDKLIYTVDLIHYTQTKLRSISVVEAADRVNHMYDQIMAEEGDEAMQTLADDADMERRAIFAARRLTLRTRLAFRTLSKLVFTLPSQASSTVTAALSHLDSIHESFTKVKSFSQFRGKTVEKTRERLAVVQQAVTNMTATVMASQTMLWLTSSLPWNLLHPLNSAGTLPEVGSQPPVDDCEDEESGEDVPGSPDVSNMNSTAAEETMDDSADDSVEDDE